MVRALCSMAVYCRSFPPQYEAIRAYVPLAIMVLGHETTAPTALDHFGIRVGGLTPRMFRQFQSVLDWRRFDKIIQYMGSAKASVGGLSALVNRLVRESWYRFHIMHPEIGDRVHAERSVSTLNHGGGIGGAWEKGRKDGFPYVGCTDNYSL